MATSKRKIYYYAAKADEEAFSEMLKKVGQLSIEERVYTHDDQQVLVHLTRSSDTLGGIITILREDGLPTIGKRNSLDSRDLELLEEEGILEASHFVVVPGSEVVAFEYNHYGPKIGLFFQAVNTLFRDNFDEESPGADWAYISRGDGLRRAVNSLGIKAINFSVTNLQLGEDLGGVNSTLAKLSELGEWKTAALELKSDREGKMIMTPQELKQKFFPHGERDLQNYEKCKLKVLSSTGGIEEIDLFRDKVAYSINALRMSPGRRVDTTDLLAKMQEDAMRRYVAIHSR